MKITLYAAISVDGFIAKADGDTDWVHDWDLFERTCKEFGCIVMGRKTFEEGGSIFDGVQHIVLSTQQERLGVDDVHMAASPEEALKKAKQLGFDKLLGIGGGKTNGSFMQSGLVRELFLDIHPIVFGQGIGVFDGLKKSFDLRLLSLQDKTEFVHAQYSLIPQ